MAASSSANYDSFPFPVICCAFQLPRGPPQYFNIKNAMGALNTGANEKINSIQCLRDQLSTLWGNVTKKSLIVPQSELPTAAPASELLACISSYYPLLMELILSVGADPECFRIADSICVEWPSPLTRTCVKVKLTTIATGHHLLGALYLESCMLLVNRAHLMAEEARSTTGSMCTGGSDFKLAADLLCRAAGILDFVAFKIENDWSTGLSSIVTVEQRPLETTPALCIGLRDVYMAQAQGMAVAQAIAKGGSKPSVLCKLARGVLRQFNNGLAKLESIPYYSSITGVAANGIGEKHSPITDYWRFYANIWSAFANRFAAEVEWEKGSYGKAVAYQQRAVELSSCDKVSFFGELANINMEVSRWRNCEAATLARFKDENSTIYYDPVPLYERMDPLPEGVTIMKFVGFVEPEVAPFSLLNEAQSLPPPAYSDASEPVSSEVSSVEQSGSQRRLEGMGFDASAVRTALSKNNQNEQAAIEQLLAST